MFVQQSIYSEVTYRITASLLFNTDIRSQNVIPLPPCLALIEDELLKFSSVLYHGPTNIGTVDNPSAFADVQATWFAEMTVKKPLKDDPKRTLTLPAGPHRTSQRIWPDSPSAYDIITLPVCRLLI